MSEFSKEEMEDLKAWSKDPKGAPFWATIKEMFSEGMADLRQAGRKGDAIIMSRFSSHTDTLEEILDLPALIIEKEGKGDAKV